ncbi:amidase signature domain-containing protein [Xylariaceae sp. FL0016]|nr:amidase signature domain-containing protein [Xylariaceae sp. FL0016]
MGLSRVVLMGLSWVVLMGLSWVFLVGPRDIPCRLASLAPSQSFQTVKSVPVGPSLPPWQRAVSHKKDRDMRKIREDWKLPEEVLQRAMERRSIADDFIESLLDPETLRITNQEVPVLMEMTSNGSLSALSLTTAFCKRAAYGHQLNNNLLEIGFEQAFERAKILDEFFEAYGHTVGPLHGLPITAKDQFHVKGMITTMGYVGWIDSFEGNKSSHLKYNAESEIIRELESLGGIIIAKFGETNNNILGYNRNARNQHLSSGGSSGGEGALQALRGSAIGIASDIGGSVSMPAAFNGVFSLKPSAGRLSFLNVANSSPGQTVIPTVPGIMGSSVASISYLFRSLLSSRPWDTDPGVIPMPWEAQEHIDNGARLSFGFMDFDGVVKPHPPIQRALDMAKEALQAAGHEIIEWKPPSHETGRKIHEEITGADGGYDIFENLALSGEPLIPELLDDFPQNTSFPPLDAIRVEKAAMKMQRYQTEYKNYWMSTVNETSTGRPVDAVIMPVIPSAAVIPGKLYYYTYIAFSNVVDHPVLVVPVTRADKDIDIFETSYSPSNKLDRDTWESYDPDIYHGAPAAIQIQCGRLEEEKLLSIGQVVSSALENREMSKHVKSQATEL